MKRYLYLGVDSAVTLRDGISRRLVHGCEVELPEESTFTRTLVEHGKLVPAPATPPPAPRVPREAETEPAPIDPTSEPEPTLEPSPWTLSGLAPPARDEEDTSLPASRGRRGKRS